jgi:4-amino-4-deoxy-L-arabinose transferase-like glycosyltransferase
MIGFSHAASPDMPFTGMLTVAMVAAAVLLHLACPVGAQPYAEVERTNVATAEHTLLASILFGFFLALAVLAKGPAAIILCGGAVFLWALFTKRWRDAFRLLHPAAILTFCVTALPWYIICARRNPDFFRVFIIEHNFKRYLTPEFQHIQPFWFYLPVVLLALFPWTPQLLALVSNARRAWKEGTWRGPATFFFACSIVFTLAFFSISKSKLPGYILPALPLLGLLVAQAVSWRLQEKHLGNRWLGITAGVTLLCFWLTSWAQFSLYCLFCLGVPLPRLFQQF